MSKLSEAKAKLDAVDAAMKGVDCKEQFSKERYRNEGPDKHEQEDEMIPESIMSMYDGWAYEIEDDDVDLDDDQTRRFVAQRIHSRTRYGMMGVESKHWDAYYRGTLSPSIVAGLSSKDPGTIGDLIGSIKPALALLLDAGMSPDDLVTAVQETTVEGVQAS